MTASLTLVTYSQGLCNFFTSVISYVCAVQQTAKRLSKGRNLDLIGLASQEVGFYMEREAWNGLSDGVVSEVVHFWAQIARIEELIKMIQMYLRQFLPKWLVMTWQRCKCYLVQMNGTNCIATYSDCIEPAHTVIYYFGK